MDVEDLTQAICLRFLEKKFFEKYDPEITSKKFFVMSAVKNYFVTELRKQKKTISLDREIEDGLTLADLIPDTKSLEGEVIGNEYVGSLLDSLPAETKSKIVLVSPLGEEKATLRRIAELLIEGFSKQEISKMMISPISGKNVTPARVSQLVDQIRTTLEVSLVR